MKFGKEAICSGEQFQMLCDAFVGRPSDFQRNPLIAGQGHKHKHVDEITGPWDNPLFVFCYSHVLETFQTKLNWLQNPCVLVSHNEDTNITEQFLPIANHPKIHHWFAQNCMIEHSKVTLIPIGIANKMWPHGNLDIVTEIANHLEKLPKQNLMYFQFRTNTNPVAREACKHAIMQKGVPWIPELPFVEYAQALAMSRYSICPEGNGMDSHRIWESLYFDTIPIVKRSPFTEQLAKVFPCIILDRWEDLDIQFCMNNYSRLNAQLQGCKHTLDFRWSQHMIEQTGFEARPPAFLVPSSIVPSVGMNVVYSYIGPLPAYTIDSVKQLRLFYDGPVYCITSVPDSDVARQLTNVYSVQVVPYQTVQDPVFQEVIRVCRSRFCIPETPGKENIFIYSFERFFTLYHLMKQRDLHNVLFIEEDNLIYDDPRKWLASFAQKEFAYMFDNYNRGASGVCYVKHIHILAAFLDFCVQFIQRSSSFLSEMHALYEFAKLASNHVMYLPIHWKDSNIPYQTWMHANLFPSSVFDAACYGIYLGGMDPCHTKGVIKPHQKAPWSYIDPTRYTYTWKLDEKGRRIPYISDGSGNWLRINNLHIHAKQLQPHMSCEPIEDIQIQGVPEEIGAMYYINLNHRTDRNKQFLDWMKSTGVSSSKLHRIEAIYAPGPKAYLACIASHLKALETFMLSGQNVCIIYEDDHIPLDETTYWSQVQKIFTEQVPFDCIVLSNTILEAKPTQWPFLVHPSRCYTASGYIITRAFAPTLIETWKTGIRLAMEEHARTGKKADQYMNDVYWETIMPNHKFYVYTPRIGKQSDGYSDLQQHVVSYEG